MTAPTLPSRRASRPAAGRPAGHPGARRDGRRRTPYLLAAPALAVLLAVFVGGMLNLLEFSFHRFAEGVSSPERTLAEWRGFLTDSYQWGIVRDTVVLGLVTTAFCAVIGYATALALHRVRRPWLRVTCYFLLFSPLLTSVVARSYGWALVLDDAGFVNTALNRLGVLDSPVPLLYNFQGVVVAMVHILLPFMVFPVLSSLRQVGEDTLEAAADLGAPWWRRFLQVTLPLSLPGLAAGCQLCFALTISAFATPSLLGGGRVQVLATDIYADMGNLNWPQAAVGSYVLLTLALLAFAGFAVVQRTILPTRRVR